MDNATTQLQFYLHSSWASSVPGRCTCIWTNAITAHGRLQDLRPNGFTEETVFSDFPVRDNKLTLHIRRRRWLTPDGKSCTAGTRPSTDALYVRSSRQGMPSGPGRTTSWTTSSLVQRMLLQNHSTPRWKPSVLNSEECQICPSSCSGYAGSSDSLPRNFAGEPIKVYILFYNCSWYVVLCVSHFPNQCFKTHKNQLCVKF